VWKRSDVSAASDEGFVRVVGFECDPECLGVGKQVVGRFAKKADNVSLVWGDVLDKKFVQFLGKFSFVYAWGSLHHTGMMWQGIANAAEPVMDDGVFVLAIYNRSFLSPIWRVVKRSYGHSGRVTRSLMVGLCYILGAIAKGIYTGKNPLRKGRGMSFYYDIVDWVGGYPYEYASVNEVTSFVEKLGFQLEEVTRGSTPIACNEFVFRKCAGQKNCG